jgi:hypothetical protein
LTQVLNSRGKMNVGVFRRLLRDGQAIPVEKSMLESHMEAVRRRDLMLLVLPNAVTVGTATAETATRVRAVAHRTVCSRVWCRAGHPGRGEAVVCLQGHVRR